MSDTANRIPLEQAKKYAEALRITLGVNGDEWRVVGSVRREKPDVGDIEVVVPLPEGRDWLHERIDAKFITGDEGMFPKPDTIGSVVKGHKPGFRYCQLVLNDGTKFDIFRAEPGNIGWITVIRTGSAEFSEWMLSEWKRKCGTLGTAKPGSIDGYLCDSMGNKRSTPTEQRVFDLIGIPFVEPRDRNTSKE